MPLSRWFVVETDDRVAARAAFVAAIDLAAPAGLSDIVPVAWTTPELQIDVPPPRMNMLLPEAYQLGARDFVRIDLAFVPLVVADAVAAWGVNWLASVPTMPWIEAVISHLVVSYWLTQPPSSRPVDPATLAAFPDALPPACFDRVVDGVTVRLLASSPLHPRCVFAGI